MFLCEMQPRLAGGTSQFKTGKAAHDARLCTLQPPDMFKKTELNVKGNLPAARRRGDELWALA